MEETSLYEFSHFSFNQSKREREEKEEMK